MSNNSFARRILAAVAALAIALTGFMSHQAVLAQDGPTVAAYKCDAPGKLTMWVWDENWQKTIGSAIEEWKTKYCPGAEVDLQAVPWGQYWDQLKTNAGGDNMPDVFNMSQDNFYFYVHNGALLDLQPYWDKAGIKTDVWGSGMVDPYRFGDKRDLYAGPVNWDTITIMYNKDMFKAAGLATPTKDWTWTEFATAAEKLTDPAKDQYGALVYMEYQAGYPNWIAATGVEPVVNAARTQCTLGEPGSLEALNFLKGMLDKGQMPTVSIVGGSSADDAFNFFAAGKVAMITAGSWKLPDAIKNLTFDWDVVQMPKNPTTGRTRSILHSVGYVAASNTKNPDLAGNLIVYLSSDEGQKFFADAGGVAPANPSPALQKQWMDSFKSEKNIQAFVDATVDSQGVTPYGEIWDAMNTQLVLKLFDQGMSVDQAVKETCDFINKNLPNATPAATAEATAATMEATAAK